MKRKREYGVTQSSYTGKRYRTAAYRPARYQAPGVPYKTVARTRGWAGQGEMKYFTTNVTGIAIPASATYAASTMDDTAQDCLFAPAIGSSIDERIGNKCFVHKISIRGVISIAKQTAGTVDNSCDIRLIMFNDMQANAADAALSLVLAGGGNALEAFTAFQNTDNLGRFKVLKDKVLHINPPPLAGATTVLDVEGTSMPFKLTHKFKRPVCVKFNGGAGTSNVTDVVCNAFHFHAIATNAELAPTMTHNCRVYYKD